MKRVLFALLVVSSFVFMFVEREKIAQSFFLNSFDEKDKLEMSFFDFVTVSKFVHKEKPYYPLSQHQLKKNFVITLTSKKNIKDLPFIKAKGNKFGRLFFVHRAEDFYIKSNVFFIPPNAKLSVQNKNGIPFRFVARFFFFQSSKQYPISVQFNHEQETLDHKNKFYQIDCKETCFFKNLSEQTLLVKFFFPLLPNTHFDEMCPSLPNNLVEIPSKLSLDKYKKFSQSLPLFGTFSASIEEIFGQYTPEALLIKAAYPSLFSKLPRAGFLKTNKCPFSYLNYVSESSDFLNNNLSYSNSKTLILRNRPSEFFNTQNTNFVFLNFKQPSYFFSKFEKIFQFFGFHFGFEIWERFLTLKNFSKKVFFQKDSNSIYKSFSLQKDEPSFFSFLDFKSDFSKPPFMQINANYAFQTWLDHQGVMQIPKKKGTQIFNSVSVQDYIEFSNQINLKKQNENIHFFKGFFFGNQSKLINIKNLEPIFCCLSDKTIQAFLKDKSFVLKNSPKTNYSYYNCLFLGNLNYAELFYEGELSDKKMFLGPNEISRESYQMSGPSLYSYLTTYEISTDKEKLSSAFWRSDFIHPTRVCEDGIVKFYQKP
jgi:hypothetical protein